MYWYTDVIIMVADGPSPTRHRAIHNNHDTDLTFIILSHTSYHAIYIYRFTTIKSLWPGDAIWQQRTGSTLVQEMAYCLTAPSHYLNQHWLIITVILRHSHTSNFPKEYSSVRWVWKLTFSKSLPHLSGTKELIIWDGGQQPTDFFVVFGFIFSQI